MLCLDDLYGGTVSLFRDVIMGTNGMLSQSLATLLSHVLSLSQEYHSALSI